MSKRLAPFSLVLTNPSDPGLLSFPNSVKRVRETMDIATNPVLKSFLAGSLSGTCSTILFQPLDLVKTRLQQNLALTSAASSGMIGTMRQVLQTEQVFGLWKGMAPSIMRTVPGVGLYFSSLHWLQTHLTPAERSKPSPVQAVCLGMVARSLSGCIMIPVTVIKTRFESKAYNYPRVSSAFVQIYNKEGARGLCCGLLPTLFRDAPFSGLYLMFYTQVRCKNNSK